jgi:hypothetical protein
MYFLSIPRTTLDAGFCRPANSASDTTIPSSENLLITNTLRLRLLHYGLQKATGATTGVPCGIG